LAWVDTSGDIRPIEARWNDTAAKMRAAGLQPTVPISEASLFQMKQQLQALQPPIIYDAARTEASLEGQKLRDRYHVATLNVSTLQRKLEHHVHDRIHRLLNDIPDGWNRRFDPELSKTVDWTSSTQEIQAEATRIVPRVIEAESLRAQLNQALNAEQLTPPETLIWALFERFEQFQRATAQRFSVLENRINEIAASQDRISRAAKYVRGAAQKAHKQRSLKHAKT
jgi:hypothetical protein